MRWLTIFLVLLLAAASSASAPVRETGFLDRTLTMDGEPHRYQVYLPPDWTPDRNWPVILFLHGAGERGADGLIQTEVGMGEAIRRHRDRFPFIVVFPQVPEGRWWTEPEMQQLAFLALERSVAKFHGDPQRIYLTGLSMGGYGAWLLAAEHPDRFAALAPVCGGIRPPHPSPEWERSELGRQSDPYMAIARRVERLPIWVFHGGADPIVPVTESRKMVEALRELGADVKYSEYEGVGHNSWEPAYAEPDFSQWLLSHSLNQEPQEPTPAARP